MKHWCFLLIAILFEVCGTICMKLSQGFTRGLPSVLLFVFYGLCFVAFTHAVKKIDLSIAYAVWSGLGMVLISIVGVAQFNESFGPMRLLCIALIVIGVIGLKLNLD